MCVYFPLRIVTIFNMFRSFFFQYNRPLQQVVVTDQLCHFFSSVTACPLKKVTVSMVMSHIPEFPYTGIFFIDCHFNLAQHSIYPSCRIFSFLENETMVGIKWEQRNQHLAIYIVLYMFICLVAYANGLII